jgi:hypothetical protein
MQLFSIAGPLSYEQCNGIHFMCTALFKNSVRTWKESQHLTVTKINWLMLFKENLCLFWDLYETRIVIGR